MTTPNAIKPTVFFARGYEPDVRLHVLDRAVYHVYSVILKLHSNFFFKFLDEKQAAVATSASGTIGSGNGQFKYEWVTQVDKDRTWSLVSAGGGKIESRNMNALMGSALNLTDQVFVFECFLQALYGNPYHIVNLNHLLIVTQFADYYCALPAVSKTLTATICNINEIDWVQDAKVLANMAIKFRHRQLLEDCVNIIAGRRAKFTKYWRDDLQDLEPVVQKLVRMVSDRIDTVVAGTHERFMRLALHPTMRSILSEITDYASLPEYYWKIYQIYLYNSSAMNDGKDVLAKRLTFDRRIASQPGENDYRDYFLCGWLEEADLPWDPTQQDW